MKIFILDGSFDQVACGDTFDCGEILKEIDDYSFAQLAQNYGVFRGDEVLFTCDNIEDLKEQVLAFCAETNREIRIKEFQDRCRRTGGAMREFSR